MAEGREDHSLPKSIGGAMWAEGTVMSRNQDWAWDGGVGEGEPQPGGGGEEGAMEVKSERWAHGDGSGSFLFWKVW